MGEVKCGYCKKTRTRKCKKTVLDQIQTLKDPHAIQKAETMLCQKKEITWTSYEFLGSCFKESNGGYDLDVKYPVKESGYFWQLTQISEAYSDESQESDERPDKDSGSREDKYGHPEGKDGSPEEDKYGPPEEDKDGGYKEDKDGPPEEDKDGGYKEDKDGPPE